MIPDMRTAQKEGLLGKVNEWMLVVWSRKARLLVLFCLDLTLGNCRTEEVV